jgi:hypothetical protein
LLQKLLGLSKCSPNAMESDIIVEGFQQSLPMHGAKNIRLIGL